MSLDDELPTAPPQMDAAEPDPPAPTESFAADALPAPELRDELPIAPPQIDAVEPEPPAPTESFPADALPAPELRGELPTVPPQMDAAEPDPSAPAESSAADAPPAPELRGELPTVPPQMDAAELDPSASAEASAADAPPAPELRGELMRQFEQWLDRMLPEQLPPEGLPAELIEQAQSAFAEHGQQASDLYSVFSALTALTGEIRLQGRAFQRLGDTLASVNAMPEQLQQIKTMQQAVVDQVAELARVHEEEKSDEAVLPAGRDVLAVLFDLHSRLERALQMLDQGSAKIVPDAPAGLLDRVFGRRPPSSAPAELLQSMREGYRLTLARLDAALHQWGIERLAAPGEPFDPEQMIAVEVQTTADVADGTVIEVYRHGYAIYGEILSTAQVKVAKAPAVRH